jgi:hypothetical protein
MCALVQAIRKIGIVGGGPGIGDAANPLHIVRTTESTAAPSTTDRPGSSDTEVDSSFGQKSRAIEDPSTQLEDDQRLPEELSYYTEENLERHLSNAGAQRQESVATGLREPQIDINRGRSFGRRKRQVQDDLEKGSQP